MYWAHETDPSPHKEHVLVICNWRVLSQNGLNPFWSIWDIWNLSCWNIKKIIRKYVILLTITSKIEQRRSGAAQWLPGPRSIGQKDFPFRTIKSLLLLLLLLYIISKVSLERYYFGLYDGVLTLKMSKMVLNSFCDKTLQFFLAFLLLAGELQAVDGE